MTNITDDTMAHRPTFTRVTADDITKGDMGAPDFYSRPQDYSFDGKEYIESINALEKIKGKPNADITIYRASPKNELRNGDWVTLSKEKARLESLEENVPINSFKVKAKDIQFAGDDITEFGYYPQKEISQLTDVWNKAQIKPKTAPPSPLKAEKVITPTKEITKPKIKGKEDFDSFVEDMFSNVDKAENKTEVLDEIEKIQSNEIKKIEKELGGDYDIVGMENQYKDFIELVKNPKLRNKKIREDLETGDADRFRKIIKEKNLLSTEQLDNLLWNQKISDSEVYDIFIAKAIKELAPTLTKERLTQRQEKIRKIKEIDVPREQIPVGEGKIRVSKLEARTKGVLGKATQEQIDTLGLSTYNQLNKEENIKKASEYVINHPKDALKVLKGEIDAPQGVLKNSIFVAMANLAKGNTEIARAVASIGATRLGQEISILTEIDKNSPVKAMTDIIKVREAVVTKKLRGKTPAQAQAKMKDNVKNQIKSAKIEKNSWDSFISEIIC